MEAVDSFKSLLTGYETTRPHAPHDSIFIVTTERKEFGIVDVE
jgi:hypothetical protein